jgi:hypothetical protein
LTVSNFCWRKGQVSIIAINDEYSMEEIWHLLFLGDKDILEYSWRQDLQKFYLLPGDRLGYADQMVNLPGHRHLQFPDIVGKFEMCW